MADGRITWQNVAAPDMRTAILGQIAAGDQLTKGFNTLGSTFKGVNDQNITDESNAAIMEAMKIQDPDAWNKMMATSGIAGLGVGAGRANSDLLNFAAGYGDELTADRETERAYGESVYAAGQGRIQDQRAEALYQQGLADEAIKQEAALAVSGLSKNVGSIASPEDLKLAAWNMGQDQFAGNPKMQAALMAAAGGVDPTAFAVSGDVLSRIQQQPEVVGFQNAINSEQNLYKMANAPSPVAQAYIDGVAKLGSGGNAIDALVTDVTTKINETVPKDADNRGVYDETPGSVRDTFNTLKSEFEGVPDVIIASLMQQQLQSNGYIWSGDQVEVDTGKIRGILNGLNTPEQLSDLEDQRTKYDNDIKGFATRQAAVDKAIQKMALAESQNEPAAYEKAAADLEKLLTAGSPTTDQAAVVRDAIDSAARGGAASAATTSGLPIPLDPREAILAAQAQKSQIDPNIAALADVNQSVGEFLINAPGRVVDRAVGIGLGSLNKVAGAGVQGAGYLTGLVDPEMGSSMVEWGQDYNQQQNRIMNEGLIGQSITETTAAASAAAATEEATNRATADALPVSPELNDAVNEYADMAARADVDLSQNTRARTALEVLASGRDPNGNPLSDAQKEVATQRLVEALESSGTKFVSRKEKDAMINKLLKASKVSRK